MPCVLSRRGAACAPESRGFQEIPSVLAWPAFCSMILGLSCILELIMRAKEKRGPDNNTATILRAIP